jgi:isopentenyl-diphosphate delta-isomerase
VQASNVTTGFENYRLIHNALPELNLADVDTSCEFLGKQLSMPILISAISGGIEEARSLNRLLANAAQEFGIAMSVGSQRIALENAKAADTFNVRDLAPNILLLANIGAVQLNCGFQRMIAAGL